MRVNIRWRSVERAGRALSPRPLDHRQSIAPLGPMLLALATVLGQTGCSYVLGPAVSERRALPTRSTDRHQNHVVNGRALAFERLILQNATFQEKMMRTRAVEASPDIVISRNKYQSSFHTWAPSKLLPICLRVPSH